MKKWKTVSSNLVFDNKWFKVQRDVVELPNGNILDDYFMWKNPDVAIVVAVTTENKIVLVRQYKKASDDFMIEVPGGVCDEGENPAITAARELKEETGYVGDPPILLSAMFNNPTKEIGKTIVYLVKNAKKSEPTKWDEMENIEIKEYKIEEVLEMIYNNKIITSGTIAAIFLALNELKRS